MHVQNHTRSTHILNEFNGTSQYLYLMFVSMEISCECVRARVCVHSVHWLNLFEMTMFVWLLRYLSDINCKFILIPVENNKLCQLLSL